MSNLHFINGHREEYRGAKGFERFSCNSTRPITEWLYANSLHPYLTTPYTIADAYNLHDIAYGIKANTVALEFHLNSFNSPDIEGYEVLVLEGDEKSRQQAVKFLLIMEKHFPSRRNRGIKFLASHDRGYNNLLRLKKFYKQAFITEAFFLNNPDDWITRDKMADVINEFTDYIS